ncbi:DUF2470 domain-containing protein [Mycobacterium sp.]|uniref:DUF2470 domain-containing protein n=1 Tax=Mycobacterium sp. TaxID=1785 RepID=UPI003A866BF4
MLPAAYPAPTTAERIRTTCSRAGSALLAVDGADPLSLPVHHLLPDGAFAVVVPNGATGGGQLDGSQAVLELTDHAPLPVREPVRSLVWVRGRLHRVPPPEVFALLDQVATENPDPVLLQVDTPKSGPPNTDETRYTLLRLSIDSVVVTDATGAEPVSLDDLLTARPDPFCEVESTLLWHLATAHADVVARLVCRLPAPLRRGHVRPLGLDRYGVRFRIEADDGDRDVRLSFHRPVDDLGGLRKAIRVLMGCPFVNGLHARL